MMMRSLIFLFCLPLALHSVSGQGAGEPDFVVQGKRFVTNFLPEDYNGSVQNWAILQDSAGLIYVANGQGLLAYDGVRWDKMRMPGGNLARCLVKDDQHRIFVAGRDYFGYVTHSDRGVRQFVNLADSLPADAPSLGDVSEMHFAQGGIFVRTAEALYHWKDGQFRWWTSTEFELFWSFNVEDEIYDNSRQGIVKLDPDTGFKMIENGEFFAKKPVAAILNLTNEKLLICQRFGLYEYDEGEITELKNETTEFIKAHRLYYATKLIDGNYCFATLNGGLIVTDTSYKIVLRMGVGSELPSVTTYRVYQDHRKHLWVATNFGLSMIEYGTPFEYFDIGDRKIPTSAIVKFEDHMYAGTFNGLYRLNKRVGQPDVFEIFEGITDKIWDLLVYQDHLLIVYEDGIYQLHNDVLTEIGQGHRANFLLRSKLNPDLIYVSEFRRLSLLTLDQNKWILREAPVDLSSGIYYISEDSAGNLWIDGNQEMIWCVKFQNKTDARLFRNPQVEMFDTSRGLPGVRGFTMSMSDRIYYIDDLAFEMLTYDDSLERFRPLQESELILPDATNLVLGNTDKKDNFWIVDRSTEDEKTNLAINNEGHYEIKKLNEQRISDRIGRSIYYEDGLLWHGGNDGIYLNRIDHVDQPATYKAFVSKIRYRKDSILAGSIRAKEHLEIPYKENAFRFFFGCNSYEEPSKIEFQSFLEGYEEVWTDWTSESSRDLTNLSEGSYVMNVRANNIYDRISTIDSYAFTILPPWHRTWWAYLSYLILGILGTAGLVRIRSNQLRKDKLALQKIVSSRTAELQVRNEQLEDQKTTLSQQAEELKEVDQLKSRLLANISHEFRTPLTLIKGPLDQLRRFPESNLTPKNARMMHRNADRLMRLVNQLLDLSKLDSGTLPINLVEGSLYKCLRSAASAFSSHAAQRNLDFQIRIPAETLWAAFDRDKMEEVVYNLLSNAFKFTSDEGRIMISASHEEGLLNLEVSDTGKGIPSKDQLNVFNRFYQVDGSSTKSSEGSGIGLSLVKEFVDLMQGEITLQSKLNAGTSFFVTIPISKIELATSPHPSSFKKGSLSPGTASSDPVTGLVDSETPRVLIVEDNADMREYIAEQLQGKYNILEAINGPEGLQKATDKIPDLIITDVMMPEMDGMQLCEILKTDQRTSHIPIIMLTAKAGMANKLEALETGADVYLTKPFNSQELFISIKNLIRQRQIMRKAFGTLDTVLEPKTLDWPTIDQEFIEKVSQLLEDKMGDADFGVPAMQKALTMSKTQLHRKMKALTNHPPGEFLRNFRLKRAAQILNKGENVTQVAYAVGFNNLSYFAKCFKDLYGVSPRDYIKKN